MSPAQRLQKAHFEALSEFRHQLSRFVHFSETAVRRMGLTPLQYLLLLHIKGFAGREWATVSELAARLQMKHNAAVALVTRCEAQALVERRRSQRDARVVEVHLLDKGATLLEQLVDLHRSELASLESVFKVTRITSFNEREDAPQA